MRTKLITLLLLATLAIGQPAISEEPKTEAPVAAEEATKPTPEAFPSDGAKPEPEAAVQAKDTEEKKPAKTTQTNKSKKGDKVTPYPLDNCIVTDNKLGSMGDPYSQNYEGQEFKFCCKPCIKTFDEDPAKYVKKLKELS